MCTVLESDVYLGNFVITYIFELFSAILYFVFFSLSFSLFFLLPSIVVIVIFTSFFLSNYLEVIHSVSLLLMVIFNGHSCHPVSFLFFLFYKFILFISIFGCVVSLLLHTGIL